MELIDIGAVTVTCKTKDLFETTYQSFRKIYPNMLYVVINGFAYDDNSFRLLQLSQEDKNLKVFYFENNICHGPGMDYAIKTLYSVYNKKHAFIFDSDVRHDNEVISKIIPIANSNSNYYGIGRCSGTVNDRGFCGKEDSYIPYIHPSRFLLNIPYYLEREPFHDHGAPLLNSMTDLHKRKESCNLIEFPIDTYIYHRWLGTREVTKKFL
jgi:hypothetical protein